MGTNVDEAERSKNAYKNNSRFFWACKRLLDIGVSMLLLPLLVIFVASLMILNPWLNPGPLFFIQTRMGRHCRAFPTLKFRSMHVVEVLLRGPHDAIEEDRISPLGGFLRKARIDELPQILNVLRGEMSLIGPRPDTLSHAQEFIRLIPEYRSRHQVRPGISGLAQVDQGYAVGLEATREKVCLDLHYIENACFSLDAVLAVRTIATILARAGA